jgi:hypothetical protein
MVAASPKRTSQDGSGVLPDGTSCRKRLRTSRSVRTHVGPRCGRILDPITMRRQ